MPKKKPNKPAAVEPNKTTVIVKCPRHDSFRVQQVAGMFDLQLPAEIVEQFAVEIPSRGRSAALSARAAAVSRASPARRSGRISTAAATGPRIGRWLIALNSLTMRIGQSLPIVRIP